jgi:hypothetical protein
VLSVTGDTGNDAITITQVSPGVIQVAGTATTINQSSSPAQFNFVTGITISFLNGKDSVTMNNVSLSGDISISVGSGSDAVTVKGVSCLDLSIQAHSAVGNSDTFDLENDTITKRYGGGGLVLDDSKGAGNDTVILSHLSIAYQVAVTLSSGVNTLSADHVTAVFGSINGGSSGNNHYFDNGGNYGYLVSGFVGH